MPREGVVLFFEQYLEVFRVEKYKKKRINYNCTAALSVFAIKPFLIPGRFLPIGTIGSSKLN
jgi:hypothetical protein